MCVRIGVRDEAILERLTVGGIGRGRREGGERRKKRKEGTGGREGGRKEKEEKRRKEEGRIVTSFLSPKYTSPVRVALTGDVHITLCSVTCFSVLLLRYHPKAVSAAGSACGD